MPRNYSSTGENMGKQGGLKNGGETKCDICGKMFKKIRNNQLVCSSACRSLRDKKVRKAKERKIVRSPRKEVTVEGYQPKPRKIIETDEQQKEIRMAVASKHSMPPSEVKRYIPGTPEFDEVMKQIVPINRISNVPALINLCKDRKDRWL